MRFTLGRVVHFYYVVVLLALTGLFSYGVKYYWEAGILNIDYVSNLYDGTSKVHAVKERGDIDEIKKFVDGDRIKDASRIFTRLEQDIHDLRTIKTSEKSNFEENTRKVKVALANFQTSPELTTILNNISAKITNFEAFVTEKKWPTLTKMAINLRVKTSPGRLMQGGLFNFDKTQTLTQSINNDIEAMTNFTTSSGLPPDIKTAIINRMNPIKDEAATLDTYVDEHKKFNRLYKDFSEEYQSWFKFIEPDIALKKIQFEKSSQTILYSLIIIFTALLGSIGLGFVLYNYSTKRGSRLSEKLILDTIKDGLIPFEKKGSEKFSQDFCNELEKYRDYVHKRMSFGSIFQEAMPFASILLDSNLNLIWGNSYFYDQWQLQNFNEDGDDSLTWDFLQRFTDLKDNSLILNALRMSISRVYNIEVKNASMAKAIPYEMYVSAVEYSGQKRIMVIFYPLSESVLRLDNQKTAIVSSLSKAVDAQLNDSMTDELKHSLRVEANNTGVSELLSKFLQCSEKNEETTDLLSCEIEKLEIELQGHLNTTAELRKSVVASFENQRAAKDKYGEFKTSVTGVLDARDLLEEQFRFILNTSRELYKDQSKILSSAETAGKSVDDCVKSVRTITVLKSDFKEMKNNVDEFKSRIGQALDQLLIFHNQDGDNQRLDQFLGKIKLEMKGFEKVLLGFGHVVTQMDITVTKLEMLVESREKIDLESVRARLETIKDQLDNAQFSASKIAQSSRTKDDQMVTAIKALISSQKTDIKLTDEMCKMTGLTSEQLMAIAPVEANA